MEESSTAQYRVFVYGTLMKGGRNDYLMQEARLIADAVTKEASYLMQQFHSFSSPGKETPAVTKNGQGHIQGEIYEIDQLGLDGLDKIERNGSHYQREEIELQDGSKAWMYILMMDDTLSPDQSRIIKTNNIYAWNRVEPA